MQAIAVGQNLPNLGRTGHNSPSFAKDTRRHAEIVKKKQVA